MRTQIGYYFTPIWFPNVVAYTRNYDYRSFFGPNKPSIVWWTLFGFSY
jgi:hypothetical protein